MVRARNELGTWLRQAYRDPDLARQRLAVLEKAAGSPDGVKRAFGQGRADKLGELRGKAGWLASAASKTEREVAERSAQAIPGGLARLREAEARAGVAVRQRGGGGARPRCGRGAGAVAGGVDGGPGGRGGHRAGRGWEGRDRLATDGGAA